MDIKGGNKGPDVPALVADMLDRLRRECAHGQRQPEGVDDQRNRKAVIERAGNRAMIIPSVHSAQGGHAAMKAKSDNTDRHDRQVIPERRAGGDVEQSERLYATRGTGEQQKKQGELGGDKA